MNRRLRPIVIATLFVIAMCAAHPAAAWGQDGELPPPQAPAPGLGNIVGSPDPGPKPTNAGDRGGAAQLAIAAIMFGGIAFIGWRIRASTITTTDAQ